MSKGDNRLKILYVLDELKANSQKKDAESESRFISASELINILNEKYALNADRKSVYSYIESLIQYGYTIERSRRGYYLQEHYNKDEAKKKFELAELKMIVDALSSSRFISAAKTKKIISKLENLTDDEGKQLKNRKLYLEDSLKSSNNSVIYNIDSIYNAINDNKKISFRYQTTKVDFSSQGEKLVSVTKKNEDGTDKHYTQSPFALVWKNEYYYLLCYDSDSERIKTFRVDRMISVNLLDEKREGNDVFKSINISEYTNTAFSMFSGETVNVTLRVKNTLASVISDRFGKKTSIYHDDDPEFFLCTVNVQVSDQFYSWLSGFAGDIELYSPEIVRTYYVHYLESLILVYNDK